MPYDRYARRMVKDHKAAAAKLEKVAKQTNLMLPESLGAEHEALEQTLSGLQGDAFDREYAKAMAKGHDKAVALFEAASGPADDRRAEGVRRIDAATLREHDKLAHSLNAGKKE